MEINEKTVGQQGRGITRRKFVGGSAAAAAAFTIVPRSVLGASANPAPSEKVNLAFIGLGGQGRGNLSEFLNNPDVHVTSLCDVDGGELGRAVEVVQEHYAEQSKSGTYEGCASYVDFYEMLEKESDIDGVVVSTPDHTHAVACMAAIKKGKHVFCEKPLAHSVHEVRMVTEAARKAGVATQMGNQGHSGEAIRLAVEWIRDGAIGPVREVHGSTGDGGLEWTNLDRRPPDAPPVPRGLDWDRWLGPAPYRPYNEAYHPYNWRGWWDFGNGGIGDMACHNLDAPFWGLDLGHPISVEASSTMLNDETVPSAALYHYEFPARGDMPPVTLKWYDGGLMPPRPRELEEDRRIGREGCYIVGDDGIMMCGGWADSVRIIPESKMKAYKRPPKTISRVRGHHRDWINACKGGNPASSNFDYGGPLTEMVLLGNVALRTGKKIYWDGANMKATNAPEADEYIKPAFREGWSL